MISASSRPRFHQGKNWSEISSSLARDTFLRKMTSFSHILELYYTEKNEYLKIYDYQQYEQY